MFTLRSFTPWKTKSTSVELTPSLPPEELERRESSLNARIAAFETLMRQQSEDSGVVVRQESSNPAQLEQTADELANIADALEARERKIAELTANLRTREKALLEKKRELETQESRLARERAEARQTGLRLLAAQAEIDEKERLFEERSHRTLETIRLQRDELKKMREAA